MEKMAVASRCSGSLAAPMRAACRRALCRPQCSTAASARHVAPLSVHRRDVRAYIFKFGSQDSTQAGIYGSQKRADYAQTDLEDYFNYMGILAEEGNYDSLDKLVKTGMHPIDCILVLACGQNDVPKVQEILRAGADLNVRDPEGRAPRDLVTKEELRAIIDEHAKTLAKA